MKKILLGFAFLLLLSAGIVYYYTIPLATSAYYGGYDASQTPFQEAVSVKEEISILLRHGTINFQPVARYEITAKIQSKQRYYNDWSAKIAPYDFALAWGKLVDKELDKFIRYSQTGRFYIFRYKAGTPVPQQYISEHSANTHVIPANKNLRKAMFWLRKKQMVKMEGYLVNVNGHFKGSPVWWNTSTVRTDTGNGACEIMYVTRLYYKNKIYE